MSEKLYLFGAMLLLHLLYDFHWQGPFIAEYKGKYDFILAVHALTWAMLLCVPWYFAGALTWGVFAWLFVTHALIDRWKARKPRTPETWPLIYVDQALHLVTMIFVLMA